MPGFLVDATATLLCAHGATAQPLMVSSRVLAGGAPIVTAPAPYMVAGCPNILVLVPFPCITANFIAGATRVTSMNQPVLLDDGTALATPTGMKLNVVSTQTRVQGK